MALRDFLNQSPTELLGVQNAVDRNERQNQSLANSIIRGGAIDKANREEKKAKEKANAGLALSVVGALLGGFTGLPELMGGSAGLESAAIGAKIGQSLGTGDSGPAVDAVSTAAQQQFLKGQSDIKTQQDFIKSGLDPVMEGTKGAVQVPSSSGNPLFFKRNKKDGKLRYSFATFYDDKGDVYTRISDQVTGDLEFRKGTVSQTNTGELQGGGDSLPEGSLPKLSSKPPSETKGKMATGLQNAIDALDELDSLAPKLTDVGNQPMNEIINQGKKILGDVNVSRFETAAILASKQLATAFEGGRLSDKDYEIYRRALPDINDTLEQRIEKSKQLRILANKAIGQEAGTYNNDSVDIDGQSFKKFRNGKILVRRGSEAGYIEPEEFNSKTMELY